MIWLRKCSIIFLSFVVNFTRSAPISNNWKVHLNIQSFVPTFTQSNHNLICTISILVIFSFTTTYLNQFWVVKHKFLITIINNYSRWV
jgi:hypothetical protein